MWCVLDRRHWSNFLKRPWRDRLLVLEAVFWLCTARVSLAAVEFARIGRHIGPLQSPSLNAEADPSTRAVGLRVAWAIDRAARVLPLRLVCLPRALAAWKMLQLRGVASRVHCGAAKNATGAMLTHVWVEARGVEITGYPTAHEYVEIGYYSRASSS